MVWVGCGGVLVETNFRVQLRCKLSIIVTGGNPGRYFCLDKYIFNERKLVLELLNVVKVKVKVTMKKFRNRFLLPESLDDL